jgi:hypothetical protein
MSNKASALDEPLKIAEWWKNRRGESIRISLSTYNGRNLIDLRSWYTGDDGVLKPGKGLTALVSHLPRLASAVAKAETKARELGLIEDTATDAVEEAGNE